MGEIADDMICNREEEEEYDHWRIDMANDKIRAEGLVQYVNTLKTKVGNTYNIRLEDDPNYYGFFKTYPNCEVGDFVEFEWAENGAGFKNVVGEAVTVTDKGVDESAGAAASKGKAAEARKKSNNKDRVIQLQSCRNSAIAILALAQEAGALDLGAKAGKAGKLEALQVLLANQTLEFWNDNRFTDESGNEPFTTEEA